MGLKIMAELKEFSARRVWVESPCRSEHDYCGSGPDPSGEGERLRLICKVDMMSFKVIILSYLNSKLIYAIVLILLIQMTLPGCGRYSAVSEQQPAVSPAINEQPLAVSPDAVNNAVPYFDSNKAFDLLEAQCVLGTRHPGGPGHVAAKEFFSGYFRQLGLSCQRQDFIHRDKHTGEVLELSNFIVQIEGRDSQLDPLFFCAHWDTRPRADRESDPRLTSVPIPGANDGASGVAVLLELARVLKGHPPLHPVYIVLFDGEDYGLTSDEYFLGSRHFAANLPAPCFAAGILLDMVGDKQLQFPIEGFSAARQPELVEAVWGRAQALGLSEFVNSTGPYIYDDHIPLLDAGIPAINIIDFDYPYWHTLRDLPEECSAQSLNVTGRLLLDLAVNGL